MKKNILFFIILILMTDLFAEQVIKPYIKNDWPDSRYVEHKNGTVTDTRTGLMWKKCIEGITFEKKSCNHTNEKTRYNWKAALERAQKSRFAGYSDWRVPNIKELGSLIAYDRSYPSMNDTIFPFNALFLWSSSPDEYHRNNSWILRADEGYFSSRSRDNSFSIYLVRLGQ